MTQQVLKLKAGAERRVRGGHPWVYSNEVDVQATPLKPMQAGGVVVVHDSRGKPMGVATVSPKSLICARLYSRDAEQTLDLAFFEGRFRTALAHRDTAYPGGFYRLCYGDADGLPGVG